MANSRLELYKEYVGVFADNKRGRFDYDILETFEAGIALYGYEVKSIKTGRISLLGSYVVIKNGEAFLLNATIPPYQPQNTPPGYDPTRSRKLLLKKREINTLVGKTNIKGLTLVPLRVYTARHGRIKLEFGLGKGRKKIDKRQLIKKRETKRKIEKVIKGMKE